LKNDVSEYQKLHDKLNYLQSKINDLSSNIDKKREEKWVFLENEKK
jgi:TolA-binding protein